MAKVTSKKTVNPQQLYAELIAKIPAIQPVPFAGMGFPMARVLVETSASGVVLTIPDGVDPVAVGQVLSDHVPANPPPPQVSTLDTVLQAIQAAPDMAAFKAILRDWVAAKSPSV